MRIIIFILFFTVFNPALGANESYLGYSQLPSLPANSGYINQPGLAGLYTGIDDDVLIVAGGANFPTGLPWEGGTKIYYDEIFILIKNAEEKFSWKRMSKKLPFASAYGGAVDTHEGLLCFGGNTERQTISESWFINYLPKTGTVEINSGPALPVPLTNFAFAKSGNIVYVAGGLSTVGEESGKYFFMLDTFDKNPANWEWQTLPSWEGKPRTFAVGVSQSNGLSDCFYLFSGRNIIPGENPEILFDAHVYNPSMKEWSIIADGKEKEFPVMAGTAFSLGASTIIFPTGASGEMMIKQLTLEEQIINLKEEFEHGSKVKKELDALNEQLVNYLNNHPGFGRQVMAFNTLTYETYIIDSLPQTGQVTTSAVKWNDIIVIPSGEIRPGVRSPDVLSITTSKNNRHLGFLDIIVIAFYFLVLAWMGYFFSKRQKSTNDYFKGGGRIPWWAAGLSIFGTALSAITFMAIPAKAYATDWSYFILNMSIIVVAPVIVFLFIPYYRKLNVTTAYEFLEVRFNLAVRLLGSFSFIVFQIGRMGVVLFLPSIALNVVTGIDIYVCIGLMGIISLVYTMMGGIEAVIWTDVMQVVILLGGAFLSLILVVNAIDGGFGSIIATATANNKFNIINLDWTLKQPTIWVMLIGGVFANVTTYGTDQTMVQRYMVTNSQKEAGQSVWANAILTIPATLIFFFAGTALYVFYKSYPTELNPTFSINDAIFPWYIISQLPQGVSGLLIAAIFAAAMSSLSSSMNSAATAYATDIHFRFGWSKKKNKLKLARHATLTVGFAGILFAFLMATMDVKSLWDQFQIVLGLVIGSLGGVFLLGILSRRANSYGVLVGILVSITVQAVVSYYQPVHLLLYAATGVISCYTAGYVASLMFSRIKQNN